MWVGLLTVPLILLALTNDLHQTVFVFKPGFAAWDSDYSYEPGFIVVTVWEYLLYAASVANLIAKCSIANISHRMVNGTHFVADRSKQFV